MDSINETKKIMRKAIKSYAKKRNEEVVNTQIKIYTDCEKATPMYKILTSFNEEVSEEISLKQLMLLPKVDFTGQGLKADIFVTPTIKNILKRLGSEYKKEVTKMSIYVATSDVSCEDLKLILCIDNKPYKRLKFKDILD
tara:strand:- start:951 stop:1370 length:420 start_codon:yes stop_codon:yes gene_type:complete